VVTYDPRGLGRSVRTDGRVDHSPTVQADDVHAVIDARDAVGEESLDTFSGRTTVATAELLGQQATVFPSHHGGFLGGEFGYAGQPEAFAHRLREVLDQV
jgi:hypothetical protein